jgi:hypothetical protein
MHTLVSKFFAVLTVSFFLWATYDVFGRFEFNTLDLMILGIISAGFSEFFKIREK